MVEIIDKGRKLFNSLHLTHMDQKGFTNIILIVLIVIVVAIAGYFILFKPAPSGGPEGEEELADWKTYRNDEYGFEIEYPISLAIRKTAMGGAFRDSGTSPDPENDLISFAVVEKAALWRNLPLEEYAKKAPEDTEGFKKIISIQKINNGYKVKSIYYSFIIGKEFIGIETIFGINNNKVVKIYLEKSDKEALYDQILSTFRFTD